jgi:hypothetical protein
MPDKLHALAEARRLVARGAGYDTIVSRLVRDLGVAERRARAITAEAFRPPRPRRGITLAEELKAIVRLLDGSPRR